MTSLRCTSRSGITWRRLSPSLSLDLKDIENHRDPKHFSEYSSPEMIRAKNPSVKFHTNLADRSTIWAFALSLITIINNRFPYESIESSNRDSGIIYSEDGRLVEDNQKNGPRNPSSSSKDSGILKTPSTGESQQTTGQRSSLPGQRTSNVPTGRSSITKVSQLDEHDECTVVRRDATKKSKVDQQELDIPTGRGSITIQQTSKKRSRTVSECTKSSFTSFDEEVLGSDAPTIEPEYIQRAEYSQALQDLLRGCLSGESYIALHRRAADRSRYVDATHEQPPLP